MSRGLNLLGVLVCAGMLVYAIVYAQGVLGLEPCPLCIFQRIGIALIGLLFLLAAAQNPRRWGARVYGVLLLLAVLATIGVAARHVWIQSQPPGTVASCGASLGYMVSIFPVGTVIRKVLTGSGECAKVTWRFLGLTMPAWVLISAACLGILAMLANFGSRGATRRA
ncbi:MAG TPA: disulfide bond formation protein B [Steroidobacteraceae bacterium]|jgi:disulfide bond formation protein DsbB|nr:disulfide bond formation protein B [Steroidobacteraceae bacterium]